MRLRRTQAIQALILVGVDHDFLGRVQNQPPLAIADVLALFKNADDCRIARPGVEAAGEDEGGEDTPHARRRIESRGASLVASAGQIRAIAAESIERG